MPDLRAPFIWFGGKRRVADLVWSALGDVDNYVEPFAGSLAVLLARPAWHRGRTETVNDADMFLSNFWRALAGDPEAVASWADWPVNEADLFARHLWLVNDGRATLAAGIERDPDWYDAKIAGWWVWGLNSWIGSGWCSGEGPWTPETVGLGDAGQGVNRQLPHLGDAGQDGSILGINEPLYRYFRDLAARLRRVRVCCGDWSRVVTDGALAHGSSVGVFLDPPYLESLRDPGCYSTETPGVSVAARDWAISAGNDPRVRIVLAGYEPEHEEAMARAGWTMHTYTASAAYQTRAQTGGGKGNQANRRLERLWFSPHCQHTSQKMFKFGALECEGDCGT